MSENMSGKERILQFCKWIQRITITVGILSVLLPVIFWNRIPDMIPSHYDAAGVADNYSDKGTLILLFFVVLLMMGMMGIAAYSVKAAATSQHAKEAEKSMLETVYPALLVMNLVLQLMFAYMIFCSAAGRNLGKGFLGISITCVLLPLAYILIKQWRVSKRNPTAESQYREREAQEACVVYHSKVDWWLGLMLGGCVLWMIWLTVEPVLNGEKVPWYVAVTTIITILILAPLLRIRYVFYSDHLLISCGAYGKDRIPYDCICGVKETRNPLSSAALSLDRIQIDYIRNGVHQMVLISPVRKKEFLDRLQEMQSAQ